MFPRLDEAAQECILVVKDHRMGTKLVAHSETLYGCLQQLVDGSDADDTDGLEWFTGRIVPSKNRIWQNLFIAGSLHLALAFALLLVPPSVIKTNTLVLQVQLVSLAGNGDPASPGSGPPGDRPGASEGGRAGTLPKASANPSEDRNADSPAIAQLVARTEEPDASEVAAPVPDEKPVVMDQHREFSVANAPEVLKNAATPTARPPSSAKKDARKTPSKAAKAESETDRGRHTPLPAPLTLLNPESSRARGNPLLPAPEPARDRGRHRPPKEAAAPREMGHSKPGLALPTVPDFFAKQSRTIPTRPGSWRRKGPWSCTSLSMNPGDRGQPGKGHDQRADHRLTHGRSRLCQGQPEAAPAPEG